MGGDGSVIIVLVPREELLMRDDGELRWEETVERDESGGASMARE